MFINMLHDILNFVVNIKVLTFLLLHSTQKRNVNHFCSHTKTVFRFLLVVQVLTACLVIRKSMVKKEIAKMPNICQLNNSSEYLIWKLSFEPIIKNKTQKRILKQDLLNISLLLNVFAFVAIFQFSLKLVSK